VVRTTLYFPQFKAVLKANGKLVLGTSVTVLFACNSYAQDTLKADQEIESAYISVKLNEESLKYNFTSIIGLEENADNIFDEINREGNNKDTQAEVTIEIAVRVNKESVSTTLAGCVKGTQANVVVAAKKLRSRLTQVIMAD